MAACATSASDDASRCLLLALSHDELGVIFDGLADPLEPVVAVALGGTCSGLRTPLRPALEVLQERHEKAKALCHRTAQRRLGTSSRGVSVPEGGWIAWLRTTKALHWGDNDLTADDMATLGVILRTNGLPRLHVFWLIGNGLVTTTYRLV